MRRLRPKATTAADTAIGALIRAQRLARKMTQMALADALGITFQQLQKYETGKNRVSAGRLQRLAEIFGVPVNALFGSPSPRETKRTADLAFLDSAGAMRLIRAYAKLSTPRMKRALVGIGGADGGKGVGRARVEDVGTALPPSRTRRLLINSNSQFRKRLERLDVSVSPCISVLVGGILQTWG